MISIVPLAVFEARYGWCRCQYQCTTRTLQFQDISTPRQRVVGHHNLGSVSEAQEIMTTADDRVTRVKEHWVFMPVRWMTQSAANCSLRVKFPDEQGKYREFPQFGPRSDAVRREKARVSFRCLVKFPTRRNRELFHPNRELKSHDQGTFRQEQGRNLIASTECNSLAPSLDMRGDLEVAQPAVAMRAQKVTALATWRESLAATTTASR